ncbi:acyl-CoA synthetase [Streptomyces sp. DSM 42041]|uniref:Acyl-CoA synthetase n=1 Tax=Streptomyces hazeniae TaxID=3075538 RepID=A0ABU2NWQ5_9ACTN|nr:acyl-CoA synthetase [Streptomyces sp. DSM 42041]MDT0381145.1 acyl-CoA synthetase [Streptomyces sp. DSM 42041]
MSSLFPALRESPDRTALRFGTDVLTYGALDAASGALAEKIAGAGRIAVWATPSPHTAVAVVAALRAGVPAVPLNPRTGTRELAHILGDSAPALVLAAPGEVLPEGPDTLPRVDVSLTTGATPGAAAPAPEEEPGPETAALVVYTSGTTGPPKGAVIPRRAVAHTLDALAGAWGWTADDVLVHALPLFHVHGLVLGVLGPLRRGGTVHHLGRFDVTAVARELAGPGTMLFGVPTMYHRLAEAVADDRELAGALSGARLLVSGSAPLPLRDHQRIAEATGRHVVERYGMTETLMNTSVRLADDGRSLSPARPGTVGPPLDGVELRLVDEAGAPLEAGDGETVGEVEVRGLSLFTGYLGRPEATAAAFTADGWFRTGDMATTDAAGAVTLVGRKSTDLVKSGGYKIGAGEIENALLEHPGVAEAAVTGEPDPDLGERVVAWVVPRDAASPPGERELAEHVSALLAPHKRPRRVRYLDALPRNDMGKILKRALDA